MNKFAIIDFETTGLGADYCRVIEVGAALVEDGKITATFTQLMNPGYRIPSFITELTGISNAMLRGKPEPEEVMPRLREFMGELPCVAHNAGFDSRFLQAEMCRAGIPHEPEFFCSMKMSRRLIQDSPCHKLGTLASHLCLTQPESGNYHRALYDVLLTAELWKHMENLLTNKLGGIKPDPDIYRSIMKKSKKTIWNYLDKIAAGRCACER